MSKSNVNPVFKSLDERGEGAVTRTAIMERLAKSGIALSDARLSRFRKKLEAHRSDKFGPGAFEKLLRNNGSLFERVVKSTLIVPDFYSFRTEIKSIYESVIGLRDGKVADYIPQLARISEDKFAVAICAVELQARPVQRGARRTRREQGSRACWPGTQRSFVQ
jgi:glutaminase